MAPSSPPVTPMKMWPPDQQGDHPTIFERYKILSIIGQGGMGTVFKGYHVNLKRFVAIKTLRIGDSHGPTLLDRFRREMEVIGQLDHPNVVRATDAGEKNGVVYLVMEHLNGLDLGRLVTQRGRLEVADACELTRQAALGLNYIHQTLVHRDIKPSNLMLTSTGLVKILDLGLARPGFGDGDELTPQGFAVGTFAFIAPEQATAKCKVDGRADIYSLGCTLLKLLTGQAPFSGPEYDNSARQIYAHCHVPLTESSGFAAVPDELKPLLLRAMAKEPGERFQTGQDVADALAPFAVGSQTLRLLADATAAAPTPERPLGVPYPEELSRLTAPLGETAQDPPAAAEGVVLPKPKRSWKRVGMFLGFATVVVGLAAWGWLASSRPVPREQEPTKEIEPGAKLVRVPGLRLLDDVPLKKTVDLLDEPPLPIGGRDATPDTWHWNKDQQSVKIEGADFLLLQLGTTSRQRFTLECTVRQNPWVGQVGVFWGYREEESVKKAKAPQQDFAWFQINMIHQTVEGAKYSVRRAAVSLFHNEQGQICTRVKWKARQDIPALYAGEKIMAIAVDHDWLSNAWLGSIELPDLCRDTANRQFAVGSNQGILGLFSMGYDVTFSKVRFSAKSSN